MGGQDYVQEALRLPTFLSLGHAEHPLEEEKSSSCLAAVAAGHSGFVVALDPRSWWPAEQGSSNGQTRKYCL